MTKTFWYRFEDHRYAVCIDPDYDTYGSELKVEMRKFEVISTTPTGAWLHLGLGGKRFAKLECRKRFACPTIEEAKASFVARKTRQAAIYRAKAESAEQAIRMASRYSKKEAP